MTEPPPPAELGWLIRALGVEATLALLDAFGGSRIYVPAVPSPDCRLVLAIGMEAAQALAEIRPRETIKPPLAKLWRTRVYTARGWSQSAVARKLGIDESTVARQLKPVPSRFDQARLFD